MADQSRFKAVVVTYLFSSQAKLKVDRFHSGFKKDDCPKEIIPYDLGFGVFYPCAFMLR